MANLPTNYKARTDGTIQILIATTIENLNTFPKVTGQMIYCSANNAVYYDKSATERMKVIDELVYWKQQPPAWVQRTDELVIVSAELNVRGASYYWELSDEYKGESTVWTNSTDNNRIGFASVDDAANVTRVARCKAIYNGKTYYSNIVRVTSKNLASFGITDVYTKTETDAAISAAIAEALSGSDTPIYSKDEVDVLLEEKADVATTLEGYGITDAVSKDDFVFWEIQPISLVKLGSNNNQVLKAKLNVEGATYQWEYTANVNPLDSSAVWSNSNSTGSNTTDITIKLDGDSRFLRCKATFNGKTYYSDIVTMLNTTLAGYGITNAYTKSEVEGALVGKADKATSLSGYGITDAYTKTQTDAAINSGLNKVKLASSFNTANKCLSLNIVTV